MGAGRPRKWYEKYMPFVAKSPEMQAEWLEQVARKETLTLPELTPYLRLFLAAADETEAKARLAELVNTLAPATVDQLLAAADVHDTPRFYALLAAPTVAQAALAIGKEVPPYEKSPGLLRNRIFQAVHEKTPTLLVAAAAAVRAGAVAPADFEEAFSQFLEILEDEKLLSTLYPKATAVAEWGATRETH